MNRTVASSEAISTTFSHDWTHRFWEWPIRFGRRTVSPENEIPYMCATSYGYQGA